MSIVLKIKKAFNNPYMVIMYLGHKRLLNWLPDKMYLKMCFRAKMHRKLNLTWPKTFNEKIQWLKLNDQNPDYTKMVDKYEVRKYITKTIGEDYLIPILGVYDSFDEIDFNKLPNQFVLKCTHDSGGLIICKNKNELDIEAAKIKINKSLKRNYYYFFREWPYKNVKPRIICEEYIEQNANTKLELRDYRFFCFNGTPKFIAVDLSITDKSNTRRNLYDLNWNLMEGEISYPKELNIKLKEPSKLKEMIHLSKKVSKGIPHVRVDFYQIGEKILFSELTFYHQAGMGEFRPAGFGETIGKYLDLPRKKM